VPPLLPHIKLEKAKHFMSAIPKGDPSRWHLMKQSMKDYLSGK
jgi:hypothetical protein